MHYTSKDLDFNPRTHRYAIKDTKPKQYIPSVTTIGGLLNKPFLVEWSARIAAEATAQAIAEHDGFIDDQEHGRFIAVGRAAHREAREHGASVGTYVHQQIKMVLSPGWEPDVDEAVEPTIEGEMAMDCFREWWASMEDDWEPLLVEQMVVHPNGKYCGTFDLLLKERGGDASAPKMRLIDWKTSNQSGSNPCAVYPEYLFQIAAYVEAVEASPEFPDIQNIYDAAQISLGKNGRLVETVIDKADLLVYVDAFHKLADIFPVYREMERTIRAFNKAEKKKIQEEISNV